MATYKISEVLDCLKSMANDGFEYIEISEIGDDDSFPDTLCISAINDEESIDEQIDAVELPF